MSAASNLAIARPGPESYVTVRLRDAASSRWPGIVCNEIMVDLVPRGDRGEPRNGYEKPVLLIGKLKLVWVSDDELEFLCPQDEATLATYEPEKRAAYEQIFHFDNYLPTVDHWISTLLERLTNDYESDSSIQIIENKSFPTTPKNKKISPTQQRTSVKSNRSKQNSLSNFIENAKTEDRTPLQTHESGSTTIRSKSFIDEKLRSAPQILSPCSPDPSSQTLELSPEPIDRNFVKFFIGKQEEEYMILRSAVLNFSCFREVITDEEDKGLCVRRPAYRNIQPSDFSVVAEFMETFDFAPLFKKDAEDDQFINGMSTDDERNDAMERCVQAWKTANEIALEEMMDMAARKIFALRLSPEHVLAISRDIFADPSLGSDADNRLRNYLARRIAEEIYPDPTQTINLVGKMLVRPFLEIAVLSARIEIQKKRHGYVEDV